MSEASMSSAESLIDAQAMTAHVDELSSALTAKAHELKLMPLDCQYRCKVVIGADGKPQMSCEIEC